MKLVCKQYLCVIAGLLLNLLSVLQTTAEGTKQLEPTNPATTSNRQTRIMFDQDVTQHRTPFATIGCQEKYRLNVYIADPSTEQIYFGFNDGSNAIFYQVRDPDGIVVTGFQLSAVPSAGVGYITNWTQANAGPKIGTINPTGYDPKILTPSKVGNYYFEFAPYQTGGTFTGDDMLYFDISVVRNNAVVNGRLWSKAWQLSDAGSGDVIKSYASKFYVYSDDGIVSQLNINEWNGGTYTIYCNQWGVTNTGNWGNDRMSSVNWPGSDLPQYKIFLNNPDVTIFPTGQFGNVCEVVSNSDCDGSIDVMVRVNKPGTLTLNIDIDPPGSGPEDVVVSGPVTGNANCDIWDTISWNGLNGNGLPVVGGTTVNIAIDFLNGLTNLPLWDVEDNASGMIVNITRPLPTFGTKLPVFWDDSNLPGGTVNDVTGCMYPTSGTVTGCHPWNNLNENMINTWWYFSDGSSSTTATVIRNPQTDFTFENNCSGVPTYFTDQTVVPGGFPIAWHWDFWMFGDTSNLQNPVYTYTSGGTKSVHLRVTSDAGCVGHKTKPVVINDSPVVNAGNDKSIPFGTSTNLQGIVNGGSGNYSFQWEPASLLVNPNVLNPSTAILTETTDFTLTAFDIDNNCEQTDVVTVTIIGGPLGVQLTANPMSICKGNTATINAQVGGGSGVYAYSWISDPPGFTSNLEDITVQPEVTTTYTLTVSDGFSNLTKSITISIYPDPVVDAGSPQTIPNGTYTLLSGSASSTALPLSYVWSPSNLVANPGNPNTITKLLSSTTNFTLTATDANGCTSSDDILVTIAGGPLAVSPQAPDSPICFGESIQLLPFSQGGSGDYTYRWSAPGGFSSTESDPNVTPEQTTTYLLVVDDGFTQVEDSVVVTVNPLPYINLIPQGAHIIGTDTIVACAFDTITFSASNPGSSFLWSNGATTAEIISTTSGLAFDMQSYSVNVYNPLTECSNTASITVLFTFGECSFGVPEKMDPDFMVYPNPGSEVFRISPSLPAKAIQARVVNLQGVEIPYKHWWRKDSSDIFHEVDLTSFPAGIYFLELRYDNEFRIFRLVKY
jgi:hypothetical protein